ncbi:expansin-like EG45 domain-containing protein [Haematococcus lacustris]|uniref:Expansin-like EG45 domain-containing protein n=1 Tax=Haematococcus lacustris TaxID=44745 RepID=A0A6A0AC38_HAELA|nr:expansin-like EG45 domain-containing protein [Haematococcus lacustris]
MVWLLRVPRPFPGNPGAPRNRIFTQCYDTAKVVRVRIVDSCPCVQVLPDGAPTVKPGGEVRRQEWCCGPVHHFDLSYWAFEQLAHPLFGAMMLEYRSVDCGEGFSVPSDYISPVIYGPRGIEPGWSWEPWSIVSAQLQVKGEWPGLHARTEAPRDANRAASHCQCGV